MTTSLESDPYQSRKKMYSRELKQLKEVFAEWSEVDLIDSLEESHGDLDLVIARISSGGVEQWGHVKPANHKKRDSSTTITPNNNNSTSTAKTPSSDSTPPTDPAARRQHGSAGSGYRGGRGGSFAGARGGAAPRGGARGSGRGGRGGFRGGIDGGNRAPRPDSSSATAVVSEQPVVEHTIENNAWVANKKEPIVSAAKPFVEQPIHKPVPSSTSTQHHHHQQQQQQSKQIHQNRATSAAAPVSTGKTSWAQLVKGPEPAPAPVAAPAPVETKRAPSPKAKQQSHVQQQQSSTPASIVTPQQVVQPISPPKQQQLPVQAATPPPAQFASASAVVDSIKSPINNISKPQSPIKSPSVAPVVQQQQVVSHVESVSQHTSAPIGGGAGAPPGLKQQKQVPQQRKLKQDAPVVMPQNTTMSSIGVRFGTLGLGAEASAQEEYEQQQQQQTQLQHQQQLAAGLAQQSSVPNDVSKDQYNSNRVQNVSSMVPQMGVPFQQLAGGFMNTMGNMPSTVPNDYSALYTTDQQRAAMGYHYADPAAYNQLAGSKYPGQVDSSATQAPRSSQGGAVNSQQQQQQQQSVNLTNPQAQQQQPGAAAQQQYMPYYYPHQYYMPNQYQNAYQSNVYPQQFSVNKSMYPYGNAPTQASTGTPGGVSSTIGGKVAGVANTNPGGYYGATGGQPHMYHQYDEITSGIGAAGGVAATGASTNEYSKGINPTAGNGGVANSYGGMPVSQGFSGFGLGQTSQTQNASQGNKAGGGVSPQQNADYKNQRQSYDASKYAGGMGGGNQSQQLSNVSGGQGAGGAAAAQQPANSYYNQHQMSGMHQLPGGGAYPAHMMQNYQQQQGYSRPGSQQQQYYQN